MTRTQSLAGIALAVTLVFSLVSSAFAAPAFDPLVGTIDSIFEDDSVTPSVIVVNYTDEDGLHHTVSLSLQEAATLGLVTLDAEGNLDSFTPLGAADQPIDLIGATFQELDTCADAEHPVGSALCSVFFPYLGASYEMIAGWHEDGYGFGVIAHALFMAQQLGEDAETAGAILEAKRTGDYSGFGGDYEDISNWGQFKKAVSGGTDKSMTNLGAVMSGRVEPPTLTSGATSSTTTLQTTGHGRGGQHGKAKGKHK